MKVLHVPFTYAPDTVGGTEIYVSGLCHSLQPLQVESVVAAPATATASYDVAGIRVHRFATAAQPLTLEQLYGDGDEHAARGFEQILLRERPDVVHQHAVSPACSVALAQRAKAHRIPVVFTYHTPTSSCPRGTLLRWGSDVCDGRLADAPCAACVLQANGMPRALAQAAILVPMAVQQMLGAAGLRGPHVTALRMSGLIERRRCATMELFDTADRIVALAPWVRTLLEANGVAPRKIVDVPHGLVGRTVGVRGTRRSAGVLRIAHLGRVDPAKGTRLLVDAIRSRPALAVELDVIGLAQDAEDLSRLSDITAAASADVRIRVLPPLAHDHVVAALACYDIVAIPSQGMETGPLVALEAFAAGVPVLGSNLGGIRDTVADGINGRLVSTYGETSAWADALDALAGDPESVERLRQGVAPPRAMALVAREMADLYESLVAQRACA